MFNCSATLNFDTEFWVPCDSPKHGEVSCRVVQAHCAVIDAWDEWVTFRVRLLLKITIQSGCLAHSFTREVTVKESATLDSRTRIRACQVKAVVCKCILHRGKVHCNGTLKVEFLLKRSWHDCHGDSHNPCTDKEDWHDMERCHKKHWDCSGDWHDKDHRHFKHDFDHKKHWDCSDDWHDRKKHCFCKDDWHDRKKRCFCKDDWHDRKKRCFCKDDWHDKKHCFCKKRHHCKDDWDSSGSDCDSGFDWEWKHEWNCHRRHFKGICHPVIFHGKKEPGKRFMFS